MGKIAEKGKEIISGNIENIKNIRRKKSDVEFSGLTDKDISIEHDLNLYTREGQFYVLVADADGDERVDIERMIDQTGCFITSVSSGIECMDQVNHDKYDLILLARNMPRMDGIQTLKNIKNSPSSECRDAKIYVILDEKADEPDIIFENAGFDGILRKPIERTILQNVIISLVPPKMLPEDEELLESIKKNAADAQTLKSCGVRFIEALYDYKGDIEEYKNDVSKFIDDYEVVSSDMIDALYSGKNLEYMDYARTMREEARKIGATYLSYCFDDHVNMAKDDSLDVAETNWRSLIVEWENVISGVAAWLGKEDSVQLGSTEVLTTDTNGIRLPMSDVKVRIEEILGNLESNDQETALRNVTKLSRYELDPDIRLKIDRIIKAFDKDKINTAVDILRSIQSL